MMPHKVTLGDIEGYFNGTILDPTIVNDLEWFLAQKNKEILDITEKPDKTFFEPWQFYEPTLSRHLSRSSLNYFDAILEHPYLKKQFAEIEQIINTKKITDENLTLQIE